MGNETDLCTQFFPNTEAEHTSFKNIVLNGPSSRYHESFKVAARIGLSNMAVSKITSSFMVLTTDGRKHNLGLSIKYEAKGLKVIGYTRKNGRNWEYSEKAISLLEDYRTAFPEVMKVLNIRGDGRNKRYWPLSDTDYEN